MRPAAWVIVAVAVLRLPEPNPFVTLVQRDAWRSNFDAPSAAISADGRYVAFSSYARLVPADLDAIRDIYVLDRAEGRVTLETVPSNGASPMHDSTHPALSADGRVLVFETHVQSPAVEPSARHVVLRDRRDATLTVIGTDPGAAPANGWSGTPAISHCGRFVAFASSISTLAGLDANGSGQDVYLFDAATGTVRRVSVDSRGVQPSSGASAKPTVSADGRMLAFASTARLDERVADGPAAGAPHRRPLSHVYVRDLQRNVTRIVSVDTRGTSPDGPSWAPAISADGRHVVFVSAATNLTPADRNGSADVFVADLHARSVELVSRSARGGTANGTSGGPAISSDGRFIAFQSDASDLVCAQRCPREVEDINLLPDVFLFDRQTGVMVRLSADSAGEWMEASSGPAIDGNGTVVAFSSRRPVDASDQTNDFDLFVRRIIAPVPAAPR